MLVHNKWLGEVAFGIQNFTFSLGGGGGGGGGNMEKGFTHEIWWKMKKKCYISATNLCAIFQT